MSAAGEEGRGGFLFAFATRGGRGGGKTITEVKSVDPRDDDAKHVGLALFVDSNEPEGPHKGRVCKTVRKIVTGVHN